MSGLWFLGGLGIFAIILVVGLFWAAKKLGAAQVKADFFEESHEAAVKARTIEDDVRNLTDKQLDDELRPNR